LSIRYINNPQRVPWQSNNDEVFVEIPQTMSSERSYQRKDHGSHILVVEDVSVTQEFLKAVLTEGGYRVSVASTVGEAQHFLDGELPDLVLLDLGLPDANGLEVCRYLRAMPSGEDIPVLIITVDERPTSHSEAVRAGADDFLRKPLLPAELQTRTRSLLRLRSMRAELRQDRQAILTLQAQKDELVQFVVHDLKNMLGSLLCSVELMDTDVPEEMVRHRQRIETAARSMHLMVDNMLELSLRNQPGLKAQRTFVALAPLLEQLGQELGPTVLRRNQSLEVYVEPGLELSADSQMIQRLLFNLLENGSKYGPVGSAIQLRAFKAGAGVRIQVADQGEGIPQDMKQRIFERFIRLRTGDAMLPGQGLGLAFCRMVMDLHGGSIWVEDNAPKGSRFLLEFPA